jgi:hypothetical protein
MREVGSMERTFKITKLRYSISNHFIKRYKTERLLESSEVIRKRSYVIVSLSCYAVMSQMCVSCHISVCRKK